MEFKKVQCVKGSYYIYLPKNWCRKFVVGEQKEISMRQLDDESLLILPRDRKVEAQKELHIEIKGNNSLEFIMNKILTAYIIGASRIIIEMEGKEKIPLDFQTQISMLTKGLLGFSIIEQDASHIEIRDLSQSNVIKATMKQMLSKVHLVFENILDVLQKPEDLVHQLQLLIAQDDIIDEYRYQIDRQTHLLLQNPSLSRQMEVSPVECLHFAQSARSLERIADHLGDIAKEIIKIFEKTHTIPKEVINLLQKSLNYYNAVMDHFYRSTATEMHSKLVDMNRIVHEIHESPPTIEEEEIYLHLDRILHHCADILEIRINSAVFRQLL
ncbi:MAG: phosphate uptake regulator [Promethearchaeota archaeon CR_4]|nr:MAG: phosphate uptake regulator [Candidatus Lokiarchaeota archaeon CR_4]